jgi:hypothetical protein
MLFPCLKNPPFNHHNPTATKAIFQHSNNVKPLIISPPTFATLPDLPTSQKPFDHITPCATCHFYGFHPARVVLVSSEIEHFTPPF